ncbi:MAG: hypothetical protein RLZZ24_11 [Pseudomonadota bacterium]
MAELAVLETSLPSSIIFTPIDVQAKLVILWVTSGEAMEAPMVSTNHTSTNLAKRMGRRAKDMGRDYRNASGVHFMVIPACLDGT